jgi:hypothetical protein
MVAQEKGKGGMTSETPVKEISLYMGGTSRFKDEDIEDIIRSSVLPRKMYHMPSISNKAKEKKDKLAADPYNVELIRDLGFVFCSEVQWDMAANVMIRGWKRASELKDASERFTFLMKLAEASFRQRKFRQAHAILMDIDEPEDYYEKKAYQLLLCHTHGELKDATKATMVFSKAIEGEDFESAIKIWASCALRLKICGSFEVAKNSVMSKARSGQNYVMDQSRMQTVESWAIMSACPEDKKSMFDLSEGFQPWMIKAAIAFVVLIFIYLLYLLERRSLTALKLTS